MCVRAQVWREEREQDYPENEKEGIYEPGGVANISLGE